MTDIIPHASKLGTRKITKDDIINAFSSDDTVSGIINDIVTKQMHDQRARDINRIVNLHNDAYRKGRL